MSLPEPSEVLDAFVVGGGPAGSTISTLLAQRGWRVVQIEKESHPRFHIGESLLPHNLPIFERLGVLEQVDAIGLRKPGADFTSRLEVTGASQFCFRSALGRAGPFAYEVRRSEFDELLFRNAAANGVMTFEGFTATGVDLPPGANPRVHLIDDRGELHVRECRFFVDASGRDTLLSRQLAVKNRNRRHASAAIFGHFEGAERRPGESAGNISIYWFEHGWFWMIPLRDGTMSVGAVCRPEYLKRRTMKPEDFLLHTIAMAHPEMRERMRHAKLTSEVRATGNYSYTSSRMRGERWIMVGDAWAFVDPIFSSGVLLGMTSGLLGAEAVDAWLRGDSTAERRFREFEKMVRRGVTTFSWFIERFNSPGMRRLLLHPSNPLRVKDAVTSILAGDVYRHAATRWRLGLFKLFYYLFSLEHGRDSLRLWRLRLRNNRTVFTGGTMPVDSD